MNSNTLKSTAVLPSINTGKQLQLNYWKLSLVLLSSLILVGFALGMINGAGTLILSLSIAFAFIAKPVIDVLNADYDISLENLELKNIHEELWN